MVDFVDFVDLFCMRNFRNLFLIPLHQISALVCARGVTKRYTPWGVVTADTPKKLCFFFEYFVISKDFLNFAL